MQKQKKLSARILSLALSVAMVFTTFPATVFAAEGDVSGTSGIETTERTITAFDELGEGFEKAVPFDGHTYVLNVKLNTLIEEVKLPTELGVTVEKTTATTTPPAITELAAQTADTDTSVSGNEPATPPDAEPASAPVENPNVEAPPVEEPKQENTTVTETPQETIPVTWQGDREYTPDQNSNVIYTPVLPEGYALKDSAALPTICVKVGSQPMAAMAATPRTAGAVVTRTTPLDLVTNANITYIAADGSTSQTANPTTTSIPETGEGWSWNHETSTLTLSGAIIDCTGAAATAGKKFGIKLTNDYNIVLADDTTSTVKAGASTDTMSAGVYFDGGSGNPTISGTGTLNAMGGTGEAGCLSCGIVGNLNIESGTITATGAGVYTGYGIYAESMTMSGGTVTAIGSASGEQWEVYGIMGRGTLNMTGGTLSASGTIAAVEFGTITAPGAKVTGAKEKLESGTITLTQAATETPVVIKFTKSVSFDARNGGAANPNAEINEGGTITLPATAPAWNDYSFAGWYPGIDGAGTEITASTTFTDNTTVYAKWTKDGKTVRTTPLDLTAASVTPAPDQGWTFEGNTLTLFGATIDCSGSTVSDDAYGIKLPDSKYIVLTTGTTNTVKAGNTNGSGKNSYGIWGNVNFPSHDSGSLNVTGGTGNQSCGIFGALSINYGNVIAFGQTYGINGSAFRIESKSASVTAKGDTQALRIEYSCALNGATITGSSTTDGTLGPAKTDRDENNVMFVVLEDGTTVAKCAKFSFTKSVSFDARNGVAIVDVEVGEDGTIALPTALTWGDNEAKNNYIFAGWWTGIDGAGTEVKANTVHSTNTKIYAKWTKDGKTVRTEPLDLTGSVTPATDQGWTWANNTLTLSGATIDCSGNPATDGEKFGIKLTNDHNIVLAEGTINTVKAGATTDTLNSQSKGIYFTEGLGSGGKNPTISGKGTLYATGGVAGSSSGSFGICCTDTDTTLTFSDATIIATSAESNMGVGIAANLNVKSGTITAIGTGVAAGFGINTTSMTMSGGTVTATGSAQPEGMSQGIFGDTLGMTGGTLFASGKTAVLMQKPIIAADATVTNGTADNGSFESGTTKSLTQTDTNKPVVISFEPSISVAAQAGAVTYGTATSPTFTVTNINFGGSSPVFVPSIVWTGGSAPTGVTTTFTDSNTKLTMTTTAATPAGEYKFKVVSAKTGGNCESAEATLKVDRREAIITWGSTTSFPYNGSAQAPTAIVNNKVSGDDVTVTVTGEQTNAGTGYTATASTLTGTAIGNYTLSTTASTTSFAITAITVTVNDGTLEVKKAFDSNTSAGTAIGKLGLTGVVASDAANISVKVNTVGVYENANVGKNKTVTLTISLEGSAKGNYTLGSTSYSFAKAEITKVAYTGVAANAPDSTPENKGDKSINIKPVTPPDGENVEYAVSKTNTPPTSDSDWQIGTTFDNLDPNTEYFFFARVKESDNHAPGGESAGTSITTYKSEYNIKTDKPDSTPASKTDTDITLKPVTSPMGETIEYGIDKNNDGNITWQDSPTFSPLSPNTEYKFYTRVKENDTHKAGITSDATKITTQKAPITVSGNVKDSGSNLAGATVTITPSNPLITAITDTNGNYTLNNVPAGVYSIVVTKGTAPNIVTITETVTVVGTSISDKNMQFLDGSKNTVVESTPGTPEISAGGVNDLLSDANIGTTLTDHEKDVVEKNGGSVEIKVKADVKTASDVTEDKSKIEAIAKGKKIDLLIDLSVLKTVKDSRGNTVTNGEKLETLASIIEVYLPIPADLQGKEGLSLYRMHKGQPEKLSTTADSNGEYYTIDQSGKFMTLYLKNFSTYALGYNAFTVTISGGGTGSSGNGNYFNGDTVTINAGTKSDYSFNGWTVTVGTVALANPSSASTTFIMPSEDVTVTAGWTYMGDSIDDSDSSSDTYYYIKATAGPGGSIGTLKRVKVRAGESADFTITPDKDYQIEDVLVNGKSIGAKNYYVFTNVHSDQSIHATFKKVGHNNPQTDVSFEDVKTGDWFYDEVMEATANGWFNGTSDTTFSPYASTSRGMIATILHRMEGTPKANNASFNDVEADAYYANGIAWAEANSIVYGYGNGSYGPNNNITREQLASILYRYVGYKGYDVSKIAALDSFADSKSVSGYAKEAMSWAVGSGLISGRDTNTLAPTATATRAEVAVILVRFDEIFIK